MSRWFLRAAAITMLIAGSGFALTHAQEAGPYELPSLEANPLLVPASTPAAAPPLLAPATTAAQSHPASFPIPATAGPADAALGQPGYVKLNAPMYPTPRPNIPIWTGSTMITNQALAPHEMLYPHTYRAMYAPFYHRAKGYYVWTPFGMRTHEKWDLLGTEVSVKYRSHWPKFYGPHPPVISTWGGPWY